MFPIRAHHSSTPGPGPRFPRGYRVPDASYEAPVTSSPTRGPSPLLVAVGFVVALAVSSGLGILAYVWTLAVLETIAAHL